ncbi:MAG: hypothetical protein HKP61_02625 [Dactylosporangium sp.]|nr:hypothetical protein [Dactylosporangium sp.]NNJ59857.1 hypothetical protein [Dactylosporangium sp.]
MSLRPERPRAHHYEFAHRQLPQILLRPDVDLVGLATAGRLVRALEGGWAAAGARLPADHRLDCDGLDAELTGHGPGRILLIIPPPAEHSPEAHFIAVAPCAPASERRYFTLERAHGLDGQVRTMVGEWRSGTHVNLGYGPEPEPGAFLHAVRRHLETGP